MNQNPSGFGPTASLQAIRARARLYQQIRDFFRRRDVLEVETPLLSSAAVTDVHLVSITAQRHLYGQLKTAYLQTSPEFAMKRLVASGSGPIYQICKVFRDDEHGRKHNSEFSMLEWYRPDFDLNQLMQEVTDLLTCILDYPVAPETLSYKEAFQHRLDINPLTADVELLKKTSQRVGLSIDLADDRLAWLDVLFSHFVEPTLGYNQPVFLTDFPAEMASLAKVRTDEEGIPVAARFELYIDGLELANAYDELADSQEQARRFAADNLERSQRELPVVPVDEHLLKALAHFPPCAGIALGLDRLLMVLLNTQRIEQVISFPASLT
ncbi:EF-P lysine aminoacylase EpmA [Alkanindiges sp. WGS2144]|uniref:EF-P lysine aminoacylase EpmA n=1 Tax=Alkanindiges sp. WGS2144 TaxID=3366808 RepID=UPI003752E3A5